MRDVADIHVIAKVRSGYSGIKSEVVGGDIIPCRDMIRYSYKMLPLMCDVTWLLHQQLEMNFVDR